MENKKRGLNKKVGIACKKLILFLLFFILSVFVYADGWTSSQPSHATLYADTITSKIDTSSVNIADAQGLFVSGDITTLGKVGIGTTAPSATFSGLDISSGGLSLILGAENGAGTRTNAIAKIGRIGIYHYTNAEEPMSVIAAVPGATTNVLDIGGGSGLMNAATQIGFWTAANSTTLSGTEHMRIDSTGNVGIGTTGPQGPLDVMVGGAANTRIFFTQVGNNPVIKARREDFPQYVPLNMWFSSLSLLSGGTVGKGIDIDTTGNVGIGTTTPKQKLDVAGGISTANGQVKRDFLTWSTTLSSPATIHIKTNIQDKTYVMYRIAVEGYNYGNGEPVFSDATGYTYGGWNCVPNGPPNQRNTNYAPGVSISQYCSSDGYLVIKLTTSTTYYLGFSVSAWFVNPTGTAFDISAAVYQQTNNL